jgi:hypothetical protein
VRKNIVLLMLAGVAWGAEPEFVSLFDGETIKGWRQYHGQAACRVDGGVLAGRTAEGSLELANEKSGASSGVSGEARREGRRRISI